MGTATVQGQLWGARAKDWAELGEPTARPGYIAVFDRLEIGPGTRLLDLGCGAGLALVIARERGAQVSGLDASEALVAIARTRLPGARIEIGDMEELPFDNESFDAVTSFTSLQFAGNRIGALKEARRVLRPGGRIGVYVWGPKEDCEANATMGAIMSLLPPPPTPPPPPGKLIGDPGVLEELMTEAGFTPLGSGDTACPFAYPDLATAIRTYRSPGMVAKAEEAVGEEAVVNAIRESLKPFTKADGSVLQRNMFHWVVGERT